MDVSEQEVKYGGWLKASPWKIGDTREKEREKEGESSCAKALFITKPRHKQVGKIRENVNEVVERMYNWGLCEEEVGRKKEKCPDVLA